MHILVRARVFLARHPFWYWLIVVAVGVAAGAMVRDRLAAIDHERDRWGSTRPVLVATVDHQPGDELRVRTIELPIAALPPSAVERLPTRTRLRQRVAAGEVLVADDLAGAAGPAARAGPGTVVVGIVDPLAPIGATGVAVDVVAEGIVLAEQGIVVDLVDEVVFVAVEADRGAAVADAAHRHLASLVFLP